MAANVTITRDDSTIGSLVNHGVQIRQLGGATGNPGLVIYRISLDDQISNLEGIGDPLLLRSA